jgi:hypothetical protein
MENKALEHFKDWSNYLLVTTVAALGWVATKESPHFLYSWMKIGCIWSLALSAIFGIFTLALIPLVAEQQGAVPSFYDVDAQFQIFGCSHKMRIKTVCFPQHVLFILGVVLFAVGMSRL